MKIRLSCTTLFVGLLFSNFISAQDFSNKGKDFWVGYGLHCRMFQNNVGGTQEMVLYFATDAVTNVKVEIPSLGYVQNYNNIPANTIFTSNPLPKTGGQDSRLINEGTSDKGIHITSDRNIVAYAHIYNGNVSGATLLFPTNTLGKEYYSINFDQHSNEAYSNSFFYAIATDTGTTRIEVIPSANTQSMTGGVTYTYNLKQGEIFNALGFLNGNDGVDLTGSIIRSINTGTGGCKRIAVYSGSGKINIKCPVGPSAHSADNYMVQAFPKNAWGKNYLTVPTSLMPNNIFRIAVTDPATVVKINGVTQTGLINNFYYQVVQNNTPNLIEADKPVMVAQYISTTNQCGNTGLNNLGDPEVIYLSPVEQNIEKVIINSTQNSAITKHFINVVIPNGGTALTSFRIDGVLPASPFVVHPQNSSYSYLVQSVDPGQHIIQSDSSFNAIAYGYGNFESYGYNAGASVKDLYQFVSVQNQYATVNFPAACKSSPFFFATTFPYQPTEIKWLFNGLFPDVTVNAPKYDSTWTINGKQLYKYKLAAPYVINAIGNYPVRIIAKNPTPEGCSGEQEINYDLQVFEKPVADFNFTANICTPDSVEFFDMTSVNGRPSIKWSWNFDDGGFSNVKNPVHLFSTAGSFNVKYAVTTDIGCLSDTVSKAITLFETPKAKFGITEPYCTGSPIIFTDSSSIKSGTIVKWLWNMGDGTVLQRTSNSGFSHNYVSAGSYQVTLIVETDKGCSSIVYARTILISPLPLVGFTMPDNCLDDPFSQFLDVSSIADNSQAQFQFSWNFGDKNANINNPNISSTKNPRHKYSEVGPYNVTLSVTSDKGCISTLTQQFIVNSSKPKSVFTISSGNPQCSNKVVSITNNSSIDVGRITRMDIFWDDVNNQAIKTSINFPSAGGVFSYGYPEFYTLQDKSYVIRVVVYSGDNCSHTSMETVTIKPTPEILTSPIPGLCANANSIQLAQGITNGLPGTGIFSGKGVSPSGLFNPSIAGAGTHSIQYTYTGTNGCVNSNDQSLIVFPVPIVDAGPDRFVLEGGNATLMGKASGSNITYMWSPGSQLNKNDILQPVTSPIDDIVYTLSVTSLDGCIASDQVYVKYLKAPSIPNTFSPNGDGIHDRWEIKYLESYPGATIEIYNRYGQLIFQSVGYTRAWDGTFKGNQLPAGTYYYIIQPKNGRKQIAGFVDIIR